MPQNLLTLKAQSLNNLCTLFHLLSDKTRLQIVMMLAEGERDVTSLCKELHLAQPTVTHHLGLLRMNRVIMNKRQGKRVIYTLDNSAGKAGAAAAAAAGGGGGGKSRWQAQVHAFALQRGCRRILIHRRSHLIWTPKPALGGLFSSPFPDVGVLIVTSKYFLRIKNPAESSAGFFYSAGERSRTSTSCDTRT